MNVVVNGEAQQLPAGATVASVVARLGADRPGVAVAVNGEVVRRNEWARAALHDADRVEVLTAVQGG